MKLVNWEFLGLTVPMMEDESGELFCTTKAICEALQTTADVVRHVFMRNMDEFNSVRVTDCHAKDFLQTHKSDFGIQRVRDDMRLWSEDDMLAFAFLLKSPHAKGFRIQLRQFIKANAKKNYVTKEQFDSIVAQVNNQVQFNEWIMQQIPGVQATATLAGKMLQAQKHTRQLRLVSNE